MCCWWPWNATSPAGGPPSAPSPPDQTHRRKHQKVRNAMSAITETKLEFSKLGSRIGAEIRGLDLSGPLSEDIVAQIRAALNEHKALVFREANILTDEAQVKFASHFGPLTKAHPTVASVEGEENVL